MLKKANDLIKENLGEYDTSDVTTFKFWSSASITGAGLVYAPFTLGLSLILPMLGVVHATWCGYDLIYDVVNEQLDIPLLHTIARHIDAIEAEIIRRRR